MLVSWVYINLTHRTFRVRVKAVQFVFNVVTPFHSWCSLAAVQIASRITFRLNHSTVRCLESLKIRKE